MDKKLRIVIPKVRFENRDITFVEDFLKRVTRDLTNDGQGVNIIIRLDRNVPKINIDANNMCVKDLIKYLAEQLGVDYRISEHAIVFEHRKSLFTKKTYKVNTAFIKMINNNGELSVIKWFEKMGITFQAETSWDLDKEKLEFEMSNTIENHQKLKRLIDASAKVK